MKKRLSLNELRTVIRRLVINEVRKPTVVNIGDVVDVDVEEDGIYNNVRVKELVDDVGDDLGDDFSGPGFVGKTSGGDMVFSNKQVIGQSMEDSGPPSPEQRHREQNPGSAALRADSYARSVWPGGDAFPGGDDGTDSDDGDDWQTRNYKRGIGSWNLR